MRVLPPSTFGELDNRILNESLRVNICSSFHLFRGGPSGRGVSKDEIKELVHELGGMINVKMNLRPGFLNAKEIADVGVARISIGPELYLKAMAGFKNALETMSKGETFQ